MTKKSDIINRKDIKLLVDTFYSKVRANATLAPIFNEVAQVDWQTHLPRMYAFWESVLLGKPGFKGNPMRLHVNLSQKTPMEEQHFTEWLTLFNQSLDELFEGALTNAAKSKAANIAGLMMYNIGAVASEERQT